MRLPGFIALTLVCAALAISTNIFLHTAKNRSMKNLATYTELAETKKNTISVRNKPVVALMPHQDDEMFFAGTLRHYIQSGRPVYAVVITDGSGSTARQLLNGKDDLGHPVFCGLHNRFHHPLQEGYRPFTKHTFSAARNREFYRSMIRLGVLPEHILFANPGGINGSEVPTYTDGSLTLSQATEAIRGVYQKVGNGTYLTVGARKGEAQYRNPDHVALEEALIAFRPIKEKYFFPDQPDQSHQSILSRENQVTKKNALKSYFEWEPTKGKFAIGMHSVIDMLRTQQNNLYEYQTTHQW